MENLPLVTPRQGLSELLELFTTHYCNVQLNIRLSSQFSQDGAHYRAERHASYALEHLRDSLYELLATGKLDPKYGLEARLDPNLFEGAFKVLPDAQRRLSVKTLESFSNLFSLSSFDYSPCDGVTWDDVRASIAPFARPHFSVYDLALASGKLLELVLHPEDCAKYITRIGLQFLRRCAEEKPGILAGQTKDVLKFFADGIPGFMDPSQESHASRLVTYFLKLKWYFDEVSMVNRHSMDHEPQYIAEMFSLEHVLHILARDGADLASKVHDTNLSPQELKSLRDQMALRVIERHALKQRIGIERYKAVMGQLLNTSFFDRMRDLGEITDEQHTAIHNFLSPAGGPDVMNIPVYERPTNVVSLNPTYYVTIFLGNAGVMRALLKIVPDIRTENFRRETRVLNEYKGVLKDSSVRVPLYAGSYDENFGGDLQHYSMIGFIDGYDLYYLVNNTPRLMQLHKSSGGSEQSDEAVIRSTFDDALSQLARIQRVVKSASENPSGNGCNLFDYAAPGYFSSELQRYFKQNGHTVPRNAWEGIVTSFTGITSFLDTQPHGNCFYFKDANPRNVMVQFPSGEHGKPVVTHIDYEYGVFVPPEVDLIKLLENGLDFEQFDTSLDYMSDDHTGRNRAGNGVLSFRYLPPEQHEHLVAKYYSALDIPLDADAKLRMAVASAFVHAFYVACFSCRVEAKGISIRKQNIIGNRMNYHLLEAKLVVDRLMEICPQAYANTLMLGDARKSLDAVALYQPKPVISAL